MNQKRVFSNLENANAILNGMEDCCPEFVEGFVKLHKQPIDSRYMYEWLFRSILDVIKLDHTVLYVACGTAGYSRLFRNIKKFVGIDFSENMISAAQKLNTNPVVDFEFHKTTFENYNPSEDFDIIYLGPYGNNVPYTYPVLQKAKKMLAPRGMIFCTLPDPALKGFYARCKEFIKQFIVNKTFEYDPVMKLEKMLKSANLEVYCQLKMKTFEGHSLLYIVRNINEPY